MSSGRGRSPCDTGPRELRLDVSTRSLTTAAERVAKARIDRVVFERLTDVDLASLVDDASPGWGATKRVAVDEHAGVGERVPIADRSSWRAEVRLRTCTGSRRTSTIRTVLPGLGVARELQFALKATQWVEDATCTAFPILLHHRVMEHRDRLGDPGTAGGYTAYRGDDRAMNRYLADRARAHADLVLCFEDIPHSAAEWITLHPADVSWIVDDVQTTIQFLQRRGIVHFDVDMFNVLTDGRNATSPTTGS